MIARASKGDGDYATAVLLRSADEPPTFLNGPRCRLLADIVAKFENRTTLKKPAKVNLWTSLLLRRVSTPLRWPVIDF
jgi:hypothetical protein